MLLHSHTCVIGYAVNEAMIAVMNNVFQDVTACGLLEISPFFYETCCLHLEVGISCAKLPCL
jgi:hypothetical protein